MPAGVTAEGLEIKTVEQINAEIFNAQLSFLGSDLDASPDQPLGQLNGIVATKAAELWELAQVAYNAFNPYAASGSLLDIIGLLRGVPRLAATYGTVQLSLNLDAGTTLTAGVATANVTGQPGNRWVIVSTFTAPTTGVHVKTFRAESPGDYRANAGTITEITTVIPGWNSVTNGSAALFGDEEELDETYRLRQQGLLASPGASTIDAIRADVLRIENMRQANVYENTSDYYVDSRPPHTFEVVLRDDNLVSNTDIAQVIWDSKPAGIATYGATTANATDSLGIARAVSFTRATAVPLTVEFELDVLPGWSGGQLAAIQDDIIEYFQTLKVGENVVINRIKAIIMAQPFAWDATLVKINVTTTTGSFVIGPKQYATLNSVNGIFNQLPDTP